MKNLQNRRILLIGDLTAVHDAFQNGLKNKGSVLSNGNDFEIDIVYQGQHGLVKIEQSLRAHRQYALVFADMLMPPGWDGIETAERLWQQDPSLQIVMCVDHSDYPWEEELERIGAEDRLLILKKPFHNAEVCQLINTLTTKWQLAHNVLLQSRLELSEQPPTPLQTEDHKKYSRKELESLVQQRTAQLAEMTKRVAEDIAQREGMEAELRESEKRFRSLVELSSDWYWEQDEQFRNITLSNGTKSLNPILHKIGSGKCRWEIPGSRPLHGTWDEHIALLDKHLPFRDFQYSVLDENGNTRYRCVSGEPMFHADGSLKGYRGIGRDTTEAKLAEAALHDKDERIRYLAFHDQLTGLPNRALILDRLEHRISVSSRKKERLGVMFIDLDRFKHINDSLGHEIGDGLLKEVATRLSQCVRQSDSVARMGGDEFAVLLEDMEEPEAYASMARRIIASLSLPITLANSVMQVGASIGIACFPEDGNDAIELMKHADAAMYAAKSSGRGTFRFFQTAMTEKAGQRLQLEMELRSALRNNELELFYQPKVSLTTQASCGVEALVRWRHPVRGLVPPMEFIPIAEETGLINELGDWVLEDACRQCRAWQNQGMGRIRIAVNISAKQLQQGDLVERIAHLTQQYQISPTDLELELTESVIMANPEEITVIFGRLRQLGVTVAVDDFGTGYSSLAYLRRLPIDVLKIDRSFVMSADCDDGDAQIVKLIIALGQALKLVVVAEGVETERQAEFLKSCGCATAQGYLYSKPQPAAAIEGWLRQRVEALQAPILP